MVKALSYLRADWKVEKVDLSDTSLIAWFLKQNWSEERGRSQQVILRQDSAPIPEITIQINRWTTLVIRVFPKGYKLRLSKDLVFGIAAKSTEAFLTSKSAVKEILQLAQQGAISELAAKLRSRSIKETTFTQIKNVLLQVAPFVFFCFLGYLSFQDGKTHQPITKVDELETVEATLVNVDYQWSRRGQNYKFHLYTAEYPAVFYLSELLSPLSGSPELRVNSIISKVGEAPMRVHIPKIYISRLQQREVAIPIYSLTLLNHVYITPQETVKVDIAYKEEQAPFYTWFLPLQGFIAMVFVRYRLTRNLLGGI
jgi:hypothetical protein